MRCQNLLKQHVAGIVAIIGFAITAAFADECIFVSPTGDDNASGTYAAPYKTIAKAKQRVRAIKLTATGPIGVFIRAGIYYLDSTLTFAPEDCGTAASPITYSSYKGEKVVISGGRKITSAWTGTTTMTTTLPMNLKLDQLFLNGKRQIMARYPNYDSSKTLQGFAADAFSPARAARWANVTEGPGYIRAIHWAEWGGQSFIITGKNAANTITQQWVGDNNRGSGINATERMVENLFEELDSPGEWFYRKSTGVLYFMPPTGTNMSTATLEYTLLEELFKVVGTATTRATYLTFNNFTFTQTNRTLFSRPYEKLLGGDWCIVRAGTIFITNAENITVKHCKFDQVGGNAVFISGYNRNHRIYNNIFTSAGATCVAIVGLRSAVRNPQTTENYNTTMPDSTPGPLTQDFPSGVVVDNNSMTDLGVFEKQTSAVQISMSSKITVRHNSVRYCPRAGLNINDGTWGGHILEFNDVIESVRETGDHGPINAWGRDRYWMYGGVCNGCNGLLKRPYCLLDAMYTTIIRNNRVEDHARGGQGIDMDDGVTNYDIYNNLTIGCGIKNREGFYRKNHNNIIIDNGFYAHAWFAGARDSIYKNIMVPGWYNNALDKVTVPETQTYIDYNLYTGGIPGFSKDVGLDAHSVSADPQFINAAAKDYRVKSTSPALALGFVNFPMDSFGRMNVPIDSLGSACVTSIVPRNLPAISFDGIEKNRSGLTVRYILTQKERVSISLYTMDGRMIAKSVNRSENSGSHATFWKWDQRMQSGMFAVVLQAGDKKIIRKVSRID